MNGSAQSGHHCPNFSSARGDADGRRGRDVDHPGVSPGGLAGRGPPVAGGPGRRSSAAAGRRTRRPARRVCRNGRVVELERVHRFTHDWEAAASLLLRGGDLRSFDAYEAHDRIIAGTLDKHLERMAERGSELPARRSVALVRRATSTSTPSTRPSNRPDSPRASRADRATPSLAASSPISATSSRPPQRPPPGHLGRRTVRNRDPGPSSHRRRRLPIRVASRRPRRRHLARRLCPSTRPARVRGNRARLGIRHRHRRHGPGLAGDDQPRPVRG